MSETFEEYLDSLTPSKCVGCECSHIVFAEPDKGLVHECDLVATGEPCYMGEDSYNPEYTALSKEQRTKQ